MAPDPDLTVSLVVRDDERSIQTTLASVLRQKGVSFEVIVVDDGSKDLTLDIVHAVKDPRVSLLRCSGPRGSAAGCNLAMEASRAPLIMFLDASDGLLTGALRDMVDAMRVKPSVGLAHAHWFEVDGAGRARRAEVNAQRLRLLRTVPSTLDHRRALVVQGNVIKALRTYRKANLTALGGFSETSDAETSMYAAALRMLDGCEIRAVPKLLCYRPAETGAGETDAAWHNYFRELAVCRAVIRSGGAQFLRSPTYGFHRLAIVGCARRVAAGRVGQAVAQIRRGLRRITAVM